MEDVVEGSVGAWEKDGGWGMVLNGGRGERIRINQVLKLLEKVTGKKIQARYEPPRNGDIRDSQADISLARKVLDYEPRVHFEEGLHRTWEWYKGNFSKE